MNARSLFPIIILFVLDIYIFFIIKGFSKGFSLEFRRFFLISYIVASVLGYVIGIMMLFDMLPQNVRFFTIYGRTYLMILIVSKLFAFPLLIIDDLRRGLLVVCNFFAVEKSFDLHRSKFLTSAATFLGLLPLGMLSYGAVRNPYRYKFHRHSIKIKNLHPDLEGFKIAQISDIHSGSFVFKDPILNAVKMINDELADTVLFTGDIVNYSAKEMDGFYDIFSQIKPQSGQVISVLGNHDYGDYVHWDDPEKKQQNFEQVLQIHKNLRWDLLIDEHRILSKGSGKVAIIGVQNISAKKYFPHYGDLAKATQNMDDVHTQILMSHDPSHWDMEVNSKFKDIHLTLSGHTHGFQFGIEIPGFLKWSPSQWAYKQWAGLYQKGEQYLNVNRGFGFLGYAGRVGILPEISVLTLTKA